VPGITVNACYTLVSTWTLIPRRRAASKLEGVQEFSGHRKRLHGRIEKLDFEPAIGDRRGLPDELVEPRFDDSAVALAVDIYAMREGRRLSIEECGSQTPTKNWRLEEDVRNGAHRPDRETRRGKIRYPRQRTLSQAFSESLVRHGDLLTSSPVAGNE
jgi:hypothetical protein